MLKLNSEHFIFTLHSRTFAALADWLLAGMPDADVLIAKLKMAMLRCARYFQDGRQSDSLGDRSQLNLFSLTLLVI
jgi:hypothetical protein